MQPTDEHQEVAQQAADTLFSSERERRLWGWTVIVLVAIFSTVGLARTLAELLGNVGMGVVPFIVGCLLVLATVITQGLKVRPSGAEVAVALGVAAAYLLVFVRMSIPTERSHLVEYGVVAVFIYEALLERANQGRRVHVPALIAIVATSLIGTCDELFQKLIPGRHFDLQDIFFNVLAAVMAVTASASLRAARRWAEKRLRR